jgi:hypothetical protein
MLIIATRQLDSSEKKMERKAFVDSSYKLGGAADLVRAKINQIIDEQTGGGEIDPDPLLTLARDSMWSASRSLYIAEPHEALPPMIAAYNAIQKYVKAKKYYLRGMLKVEPVNIDRVRLTGKDTADSTIPRKPRTLAERDRQRLMAEYAIALQNLKTTPSSAIEMLTTMQVETLRQYPEVASAIGDALAAIRAGKDASQPLLRARLNLAGKPGMIDTLPLWSGAW